jgi:hypothetical protein
VFSLPDPYKPNVPCTRKVLDSVKILERTLRSPLGGITVFYKVDIFIDAKEFL